MKSIKFIVIVLLAKVASAQTTTINEFNGLYKTKEDFIINKVTNEHLTDSLNYIDLKFDGKVILVRDGIAKRISLDSAFGFFHDGSKYRVFNTSKGYLTPKGYFKLEDEDVVCVYSQKGYLKSANHDFFFFSLNFAEPIHHLSVSNLKRYFQQDDELTKLLKHKKSELTMKQGEHLVLNNVLREFNHRLYHEN